MSKHGALVEQLATPNPFFEVERAEDVLLLRFRSADGTNRLTREFVCKLAAAVRRLSREAQPLVIVGNREFFSVGADLKEIAALTGPQAYEFSKIGQELMQTLDDFPAPVYAAVSGYCMGGGFDLALACHHRVAAPHSVFGHRGAALGLTTGWGGTQRLPRLVGKGRALEIFLAAEKIRADRALAIGLIDAIAQDPLAETLRRIRQRRP